MAQVGSESVMDEAIQLLQEMEKLGEQIVADRELIIEFDRRRNKNREALRAIEKQSEGKVWLCIANTFVRAEKAKAQDLIKRDQQQINKNIEATRDSIKKKLDYLRRLEGKQEHELFRLNPLARKELRALNSLLPEVV